jgi:tRNA threonylcarbamoyladenosine biosynthesis protein TsaB
VKILAYESSQNFLSVALTDGQSILAEFENDTFVKHSDALVGLIEKTLRKAGVEPAELDALALDVGPGSFTGIRVGVATAKMLAWVWKKKIVAVSSLESLAFPAGRAADGSVAVLMDARKGKVYGALYRFDSGSMKTLAEPSLTTLESFLKHIRPPDWFTGNDRSFLESLLPKGTENIYVDRAAFPGPIRASTVALVALDKIARKKFETPEKLEGLYLQPRDCNVTKKS